jgi:hypothetical protein
MAASLCRGSKIRTLDPPVLKTVCANQLRYMIVTFPEFQFCLATVRFTTCFKFL